MASLTPGDISAIGRRDVLTLLLVDAARNVVRGAGVLLGNDSDPVKRFEQAHPTLKTLRDRIEHFDEYIKGAGHRQRVGGSKGIPLNLETAGLDFHSSHGGGPEGHVITIRTLELENGKEAEKRYEVPTRDVIIAVRTLARDTLLEAGQLDDRHLAACPMCFDPKGPDVRTEA